MAARQLISIITPIHNEGANISPFYQSVLASIKELSYAFELIFVNDGSSDDSAKQVKKLARRDRRVRLVEFARNFGKEAAVSAGVHKARGDAVIILDADLQHPPHLIPHFIEKWRSGSEVVVGVKQYSKHEGWLKRFTSHMFYKILGKVTTTEITPHASDYRLLDRCAVDVFNSFTERNRITRGLIDWVGFRRSYIHFEAPPRQHGTASYGYGKLIGLAFNSFTAYSLLPLRLAGYLGSFILSLAALAGLFLVIEQFALGDPYNWDISGSAYLALLTLFLVGLVLVCLGLIALYIARIHDEVVNRPLYIEKPSGLETDAPE